MSNDADAAASLQVLHHDEQLLVVNKPSGVAVHRGWSSDRVTLVRLARTVAGRLVYPAHRLDRGTSGVMVFTFSSELATAVQTEFQSRRAKKVYICIVRGVLPDDGFIDHAIAKSKAHAKRSATTAFKRLAQFERYSLAMVRPYTGRLHQVRRHMKHISHPLIGDTRYGKGEHNRLFRERFGLHRSSLHALRLMFAHPTTGQLLDLIAPPPAELSDVLAQLGFASAIAGVCDGPLWDPDTSALRQFVDPE